MGRKPVSRMDLTATAALRVIRRLGKDSAAVFFTAHASQRMRQRGITRAQVLACLVRGRIVEGPALDAKGRWCFTVQRYWAGDEVDAVASLDFDAETADYILIITVYGA